MLIVCSRLIYCTPSLVCLQQPLFSSVQQAESGWWPADTGYTVTDKTDRVTTPHHTLILAQSSLCLKRSLFLTLSDIAKICFVLSLPYSCFLCSCIKYLGFSTLICKKKRRDEVKRRYFEIFLRIVACYKESVVVLMTCDV